MAETDNINANTSRNLDAEGNPLHPSIYEFEYIKFIKEGKEVDVAEKRLVTSLEIVEELYSPVLTGKMVIRDNENFFEEFGLSGQEIVKVGILRPDWAENNSENTIELDLVVQDYSLFDKTTESINVQEYHLNLISSVAFVSRLQQISLSATGSPVDEIKRIFKDYLPQVSIREDISPFRSGQGRKTDTEKYACHVNNLKTIITNRTPLQAIDWLKRCCYDNFWSPFFIWSSMLYDKSIRLASWRNINDPELNPIYGAGGSEGETPYVYKPFKESDSGDGNKGERQRHLKELSSKIIGIRSNLSLNKLQQTVAGAGPANITEIIDLNSRSYIEKKSKLAPETKPQYRNQDQEAEEPISFNYLQNLDGVDPYKFDSDNLTANKDLFYFPLSPYGDGYLSAAEITFEAQEYFKHYKSSIESVTHDITIYGDEAVHPGRRIKIEIPKALDTSENDPGIDELISGTYIVLVTVHTFKSGVYVNRLKIAKESKYNPEFEIEER